MKMNGRYDDSDDDDSDDESPAWLTSYSDMMTDLLAIFVILFAFAIADRSVTSRAAANSPATASAQEQNVATQQKFDSFVEDINSYIKESEFSTQISVIDEGEGVVLIRMRDSALFDSGQATIDPKAEKILNNISNILENYKDSINMVRIEGHTDNRPIHNEQFNSNWELSTSRAVNILKRLLEVSSLGADKFSAVGYSEFHPIADNNTAMGRALNRRVDFIIETK